MAPRRRDERGVVFPSPVVILSVIAVAMAAIAFVATRGGEPTEREITPASQEQTAQPESTPPASTGSAEPTEPTKSPKPPVDRAKVYVEVYNNSNITGLAGATASRIAGAGWQVVGSDNWYGTIPSTTIYFPERLEAAAKMLAQDLGIERVMPAIDPMSMDRLTVILTADYA